MSITLEELRQDTRDHVDESVAVYWTDTELNRWINEALRDLARRTEVLQAQKSYTIEANREAYPIPDDMIRIYRVEYRESNESIIALPYKPFTSMDDIWWHSRGVGGGRPELFTIWGTPGVDTNQLFLYPIPSDTINDGLRVFYYRLPRKLLQDDDVADIPAGWEDMIPLYVEYVARRKEAQDSRWRESFELYETKMKALEQVTRHWADQQTFMSDEGGGPWWLSDDWAV